MDTASRLLILQIKNKREITRSFLPLPKQGRMQGAQFIANVGIDVLICGAISRPYEEALLHRGVTVHAWIRGDSEEVIAAFMENDLLNRKYHLPGCCRRRRHRSRSRLNDKTESM